MSSEQITQETVPVETTQAAQPAAIHQLFPVEILQ